MSDRIKPIPRWSDPVWVGDTTYRFVNVGDGPAFHVIYKTSKDGVAFPGAPHVHVPETRIDVVRPGRFFDLQVQILDDSYPERPAELDHREVGWPPISTVITLAWNHKRSWSAAPDSDDPFGAKDHLGFERSNYSTLLLPPNRLPSSQQRGRIYERRGSANKARAEFVQFERVLNAWLASANDLRQAINRWETNVDKGRDLFSSDSRISQQAHGQLRLELDASTLTTFVTLSMLQEHATRMLFLCTPEIRQNIAAKRDVISRKFPFTRHADTVRNYLAHRALLDWITSHSHGTSTCSIEVDLAPILSWAQTRDKNRTEAQNILFAEFLKQYGERGTAGSIPLRTWINDLVDGNQEIMLSIYQEALHTLVNVR